MNFFEKVRVDILSQISNYILLFIVLSMSVFLIFVSYNLGVKKQNKKHKLLLESDKEVITDVKKRAEEIIKNAEKKAEEVSKEKMFKVTEEILVVRREYENEEKERREEIKKLTDKLNQKEERLENKLQKNEEKENEIRSRYKALRQSEHEIEKLKKKEIAILEEKAQLTLNEARNLLFQKLEDETKQEVAKLIRKSEVQAKERSLELSKEIISSAIQKYSASVTYDVTTSVIAIPSDEIKGRIIGKEGRNIRAFETLTGVDLIINETPEIVILSSFDPIRREIAKNALISLIEDGRIHPSRVEEAIEKAKRKIEQIIKEEGERAVLETGVYGLNPEIINLLGKLKYKTSFGQNALSHSLEVSYLAGFMASEIGDNVELAIRGGLLHDLGKAIGYKFGSASHAETGADFAKKYGEDKKTVNIIRSHHGEVEPTTCAACLVQAADAISASRPGARHENIEIYLERLKKIEEICNSFEGVASCYAVQAGREVRIIAKPTDVSDDDCLIMAREIAKKIETDLRFPGQIKVNVIREFRITQYAG